MSKTCNKCGEVKPFSEFGKHAAQRGGLRSQCKLCHREANAKYRAENVDKVRLAKAEYHAKNQEKLNLARAERYAKNKDSHKKTCAKWAKANPKKVRAIKLRYFVNNKEKCAKASKTWESKNPGLRRAYCHNYRARKRANGGQLSPDIIDRLFKLQRGKCACCKQPLGGDYHLDHVIPLALGGANSDSNVQLLRAKCNLSKASKHPADFMRQKGFLL